MKRERAPEFDVDLSRITPGMLSAIADYKSRAFFLNTAIREDLEATPATWTSIIDLVSGCPSGLPYL